MAAAPVSAASFADGALSLDRRLQKAVARLGYVHPTQVQAQTVPVALEGHDCLIKARTGSGKTAAYALVLLQKLLLRSAAATSSSAAGGGRSLAAKALVLVPSRELVDQTAAAIKELAHYCSDVVRVASVGGGGSTTREQVAKLMEGVDILVATPSKLAALLRLTTPGAASGKPARGASSSSSSSSAAAGGASGGLTGAGLLGSLETLVVDEADLVLSFGHEADTRALVACIPPGGACQTLLVSATLSPKLEGLKRLLLHSPTTIQLEESHTDGVLTQFFLRVGFKSDRYLLLYALLKLKLIAGKAIIFVNSIAQAFKLKLFLERFSIPSAVLNSELPANSRSHILSAFNRGVFDLLIATDEGVAAAPDDAVVAAGIAGAAAGAGLGRSAAAAAASGGKGAKAGAGDDDGDASDEESDGAHEFEEGTDDSDDEEEGGDDEDDEEEAAPPASRSRGGAKGAAASTGAVSGSKRPRPAADDDDEEEEEDGAAAARGRKPAAKRRLTAAAAAGGSDSDDDDDDAADADADGAAASGLHDPFAAELAEEDGAGAASSSSSSSARGKKGKGAGKKGGRRGIDQDEDFGVARGVDFRGVTTVVNFDFPSSQAAYIHRIGRTARGGASGVSLTFIEPDGVSAAHDAVLASLQSTQGPDPASGLPQPSPLPFDVREVEGFRYRVQDVLASVTDAQIREARLADVRNELLASDALKAHFEDHPRDAELLQSVKHDRVLAPRAVKAHLKDVPEYLLPPSLKAAVEAAGGGVRGGGKRAGGAAGGGKRGGRGGARGGGRAGSAAAGGDGAGGDESTPTLAAAAASGERMTSSKAVALSQRDVYRARKNNDVDPLKAFAMSR